MSCSVICWMPDSEQYEFAWRNKRVEWATENCPSFVKFDLIDMSDISSWTGTSDFGYEFTFESEEDAVLFTMRWL